jgi:Ca-activated chloride channel homolog
MKFEYPWLLLLLLPLAFAWWKKTDRRSAGLKGASVAALLLALSGPSVVLSRHPPVGVVVVVDTSGGITAAQRMYAGTVTKALSEHGEAKWMRVVELAGPENTLEESLLSAAAQVPEGYSPRVVLVSDGNAAEGNPSRAILEMREMKVEVDTTPLTPGPTQELALESVALADRAYSGGTVPIEIAVISPRDAAGQVTIDAGSGKGQTQSLHLRQGRNVIHAQQRTETTGPLVISGEVAASGLRGVHFERLLQVSRARVVYVARDASGLEGNLLRSLRVNGADITQKSTLGPDSLQGVQLLVLSNQDLPALTDVEKDQIAQYAKDGGGLLLLGGEAHPYKTPDRVDALDQVLPAAPAPPQNSGDKCVVILIDKSSSMQGEKIAMARQSLLSIADSLSPQDSVGVLAFNHAFQWIVPIQKFRDRRLFLQQLTSLTAEGGTEIPPALSAAYHAALASKAKYRHIVLVTDGISEEGNSVQLAQEAFRQGIAISTVGIGAAVNRSFLEAVAKGSGGKSYLLATAGDLKQITLRDVRDYTGSNTINQAFEPIVQQPRNILDGVDMQQAPPVTRYTRYNPKPGAESILGIGEAGKDPLYIRWQYGLGRVGMFTTDDIGSWAGSWRNPSGFDRLWANLTRDLYSHTGPSEVVATPGPKEIQIKYHLGAQTASPPVAPKVLVLGPNGFRKAVLLQETAPLSYAAKLSIGDQSGVFRVVPQPSSAAFPATALLTPSSSDSIGSRDELRQIAKLTGGDFYTSLASRPAWEANKMSVRTNLWPALVAIAILLNLIELALRRPHYLSKYFWSKHEA